MFVLKTELQRFQIRKWGREKRGGAEYPLKSINEKKIHSVCLMSFFFTQFFSLALSRFFQKRSLIVSRPTSGSLEFFKARQRTRENLWRLSCPRTRCGDYRKRCPETGISRTGGLEGFFDANTYFARKTKSNDIYLFADSKILYFIAESTKSK